METVMDTGRISGEIARLKTNIEQWERDLRNANRDCHYATVGRAAGAGLFALGGLVVFLSYALAGIYMIAVGIGIVVVSTIREGSTRDRLRDLGDQLVYSKRRLVELNLRLDSGQFEQERSKS